MRTAFVITASIGIPVIAIVIVLVAVRAFNQHRVANLVSHEEQVQEQQRAAAIADEVGGTSPDATLALFASAVRAGDAAGASELCVPALRDRVADIVARLGAEEREEAAAQVEEIARAATQYEGDSFVASDPVYIELIKYPSGVWKVASF